MTRRFNLLLALAVLFIALPYYWLLVDNHPGEAAPRPLAIGRLRELAGELPGQRPVAIAVERAAYRLVPGNVMAAGSGMKRRLYSNLVFRLDVPGKGPVVIDAISSRGEAGRQGLTLAGKPTQDRIAAALHDASLVLATRGTPASAGGRPRAIAPGIVVIPAPVPTPGHRMIYLRMADGREYLLAGEVAPHAASYRQMRGRSRLMTDHVRPEDRETAIAWLATIRELQRQAPELRVIPGHDLAWLASPEHRGWLTLRFPES